MNSPVRCALLTLIVAPFLFASLLVAAPTQPVKTQHLTSLDKTPNGLAKSDWQGIRAAYEASRHAFQPTEGKDGQWQAHNPTQQWLNRFDQRGFEATPQNGDWTWGLELQSYGFGDQQHAIQGRPVVEASGQRLTYQWDGNVQEWFINDQRGLEHGFTVAQRPSFLSTNSATLLPSLSFNLTTRGDLRPKVSADAQSVTFQDASGATVLNYTGLKVWDADNKPLSSRFEPSGHRSFRLLVDEASARYPITIDPIAQQAYLKASNTGAYDSFGNSVAVSGDTVVVGAYGEDSSAAGVNGNGSNNSADDAGAAYVFVRSGAVWSQQAYLKASNTGANDSFGISVAVSGDTVVVGAPGEADNAIGVNGGGSNNSATNSGAAYVFTRSGATWSQQAYLKASNTGESDQFGNSVAVSGDTVVIGAYGEDSSATGVNGTSSDNSAFESGAAYVFVRSGTVWSQQAYLKASNTGGGDVFGHSVAMSGDTVVIGAYSEDSSATGVNGTSSDNSAFESGAAYVFVRSGTAWSQQAYLKASNTGGIDKFGCSVAVSGDTVVVGALYEDSNATGVNSNSSDDSAGESGAAYVFVRSGVTWSQQAYLKASNTGGGDVFGHSVAMSGDIVVVGALAEDSNATGVNGNGSINSATNSGAAYVFLRSGSTWSQQAYLKASNTGAENVFGNSVAVSGDTVVVGASGEDSMNNSAPDSGAAYTFSGFGPEAPPLIVNTTTAALASNATTLTISGSGFHTTPGNYIVAFTPSGTGTVSASTATSLTVTDLSGLTLGPLNAIVTANGQNSIAPVQVATVTSKVIAITGKDLPITNGDTTPSTVDDTNFGTVPMNQMQESRVFTITNAGNTVLNLSIPPQVMLSGPGAAAFRVTLPPANSVGPANSTPFMITFDPLLPGPSTATVTIESNADNHPAYTFSITGFGTLSTLRTQSINFTPPTSVYLSQTPLELSAFASSGLPVTLGVSAGLASIDGSMLTVFAQGTIKVRAMQAGGGNFKAATPVTVTIVVKNDPTVRTIGSLSHDYDGTPKPIQLFGGWISPTILYNVNGLKVLTPPVNAGRYTVEVIDQGKVTTGTLVIAKAPLLVTADDKHKFAGQTNPALTFSYTGFKNGETETEIARSPILRTTATSNSIAGEYPITPSGGTANNYHLIYQQGTMIVDSFAGSYEALLLDTTSKPIGIVRISVSKTGTAFTGRLSLATEASPLSISGPLITNGNNAGTGNHSVSRNGIEYVTTFTLPLYGDVVVATNANTLPVGSATNGRKLITQPKGNTNLYNGSHTVVLEPATPEASGVPLGAGWATAKISAKGMMTLTGRLGDGTAFTQTLHPDEGGNPTYRLFAQPYKTGTATRTQSYIGGSLTLVPHPTLTNRRYAESADLTWKKTGLAADTMYRSGFGPVSTVLMLDPWLAPVAAKGVSPAITLPGRLGLDSINTSFAVEHSATGSILNDKLPSRVGLSSTNVVSVLLPVTTPVANSTKWRVTLQPATGMFTGSFELGDTTPRPRIVSFSGVLRQPAITSDVLIGDGHYILPPLSGTERSTGEIMFKRP
jgi:LysM repeat protein